MFYACHNLMCVDKDCMGYVLFGHYYEIFEHLNFPNNLYF